MNIYYIISIALILSACSNFNNINISKNIACSSSEVCEAGSDVKKVVTTVSLSDKKMQANVDINSKEIQSLDVGKLLNGSKASISFQPGSLAISTSIMVEKSAELKSTALVNEISTYVGESLNIVSATSGIIIRPSNSLATLSQPMTLQISLPNKTSLIKRLFIEEDEVPVVLYKQVKYENGNETVFSGIISEEYLEIKDGTVVFRGYFGSYWVAFIKKPKVDLKNFSEVKSEEPILNSDGIIVVEKDGSIVKEDQIKAIEKKIVSNEIPEYVKLELSSSYNKFKGYVEIKSTDKIGDCTLEVFEKSRKETLFDKKNIAKINEFSSNIISTFEFALGMEDIASKIPFEDNYYRISCRSSLGIVFNSKYSEIKFYKEPLIIKSDVKEADLFLEKSCNDYSGNLEIVSMNNLSNVNKFDERGEYFAKTTEKNIYSFGSDLSNDSCNSIFRSVSVMNYNKRFEKYFEGISKEKIKMPTFFFRKIVFNKPYLCGYDSKVEYVSTEETLFKINNGIMWKSLKCLPEEEVVTDFCNKLEGFCVDKPKLFLAESLPDSPKLDDTVESEDHIPNNLVLYPFDISLYNNNDIEVFLGNIKTKDNSIISNNITLKISKTKCDIELLNGKSYAFKNPYNNINIDLSNSGACEYKQIVDRSLLAGSLNEYGTYESYELNLKPYIKEKNLYCEFAAKLDVEFAEYTIGKEILRLFDKIIDFDLCKLENSFNRFDKIHFDENSVSGVFNVKSEPFFNSDRYVISSIFSGVNSAESPSSVSSYVELEPYYGFGAKFRSDYCIVSGEELYFDRKVKLGSGHLICESDIYTGEFGHYSCETSGSTISLHDCVKKADVICKLPEIPGLGGEVSYGEYSKACKNGFVGSVTFEICNSSRLIAKDEIYGECTPDYSLNVKPPRD